MNKKEKPYAIIYNEKNKQLKKMTDYFNQMTTYEKLIHNTLWNFAGEKSNLDWEYINKNIDFLKKEIKKVKTDFELKSEKDKENITIKNLLLHLKSELKYWELCKQLILHRKKKDLQNE